jgi:hypothetical protein
MSVSKRRNSSRAEQKGAPKLGSGLGCGAAFEHLDTLFADRLNDASKLFDAGRQPSQLLGGDAVMLGVAGLADLRPPDCSPAAFFDQDHRSHQLSGWPSIFLQSS